MVQLSATTFDSKSLQYYYCVAWKKEWTVKIVVALHPILILLLILFTTALAIHIPDEA